MSGATANSRSRSHPAQDNPNIQVQQQAPDPDSKKPWTWLGRLPFATPLAFGWRLFRVLDFLFVCFRVVALLVGPFGKPVQQIVGLLLFLERLVEKLRRIL